jgi:hypothetical protein
MRKRKLSGAEAVYGFAGWLTSRTAVSGPWSRQHNACAAADACAEFCKANGLRIHRRSKWYKVLIHPTDKIRYPQEP